MLTRAKILKVVVGNPEKLRKDSVWKAFVEYCEKNKCLIEEKQRRLNLELEKTSAYARIHEDS